MVFLRKCAVSACTPGGGIHCVSEAGGEDVDMPCSAWVAALSLWRGATLACLSIPDLSPSRAPLPRERLSHVLRLLLLLLPPRSRSPCISLPRWPVLSLRLCPVDSLERRSLAPELR
mmetsp:Transcript_110218/g.322568  ORF Transcript_110218/g.322568 Transcript_110218/m.322568 type:complete len:117 (-) Transcript_110218:390-740(-)